MMHPNNFPQPPQGVKAIHSRREELKQRMQERHREKRGQLRRERLEAARAGGTRSSEKEDGDGAGFSTSDYGYGPSTTSPFGGRSPQHDEEEVMALEGHEWMEFGNQFRVDVTEPAVMEYLLQLEQEIRQEQLVAMFDDAHNPNDTSDLEAYYQHLMSS